MPVPCKIHPCLQETPCMASLHGNSRVKLKNIVKESKISVIARIRQLVETWQSFVLNPLALWAISLKKGDSKFLLNGRIAIRPYNMRLLLRQLADRNLPDGRQVTQDIN